jgi:hypothetical protein
MIFLMAANAPTHGERFLATRYRHCFYVTMAISASLLDWLALLKNKTLDVALMVEAYKIREVVHLFPWHRFFCLPVFK